MRIDSDAAFAAMAFVEGEAWANLQTRHRNSPHGFFAFQTAWFAKQAYQAAHPHLDLAEHPLRDFSEGELDVIYGAGGYSRYSVLPDGEIVLLGWSVQSLPARRDKAEQVGIRVSPFRSAY